MSENNGATTAQEYEKALRVLQAKHPELARAAQAKDAREFAGDPTVSPIGGLIGYCDPPLGQGELEAIPSAPVAQLVWDRKEFPKTVDYIAALEALGYRFRLNVCTDTVEINGESITDQALAEIRAQMRDLGYRRVNVMEDAFIAHAGTNRYHPVKEYLESLEWDGKDHILKLSEYIKDENHFFYPFFLRWAIGAVARVYEKCSNRMLVLDGPQGCGKSFFCHWLVSGARYGNALIESPIFPDNKDHLINLISCWLWEVGELGATMRKADREALKFFLTLKTANVRKPYGHFPIVKPAISSFIGTINNEAGFLNDPTGHRRYMCLTIQEMDWQYATDIDPNQVWAQAKKLYDAGEPWELDANERSMAKHINRRYEVEDILSDLIFDRFELTGDPGDFVPTMNIVDELHKQGWRMGAPRAEAMAVTAELKKRDLKSEQKYHSGSQKRGYVGLKERY